MKTEQSKERQKLPEQLKSCFNCDNTFEDKYGFKHCKEAGKRIGDISMRYCEFWKCIPVKPTEESGEVDEIQRHTNLSIFHGKQMIQAQSMKPPEPTPLKPEPEKEERVKSILRELACTNCVESQRCNILKICPVRNDKVNKLTSEILKLEG